MTDEFLYVEKYRPKTVDEAILPQRIKDMFKAILADGQLPNMIFTGTAGLGKTTIARALCNQLDLDYILINGSEEGNIDTLRGKIRQFASTVSLRGGYKVVILDEADYLNPQSTQPALRGFIEEFSNNCRFILTCNFRNRIIEPLHSRCSVIEFNATKKELAILAAQFFKRAQDILVAEGIEFDQRTLASVVSKHAPDWRRVLNELQKLAYTGSIGAQNLREDETSDRYGELFDALKAKNFKTMRAWVVNNQDVDSATIYRAIYDRMMDRVEGSSIPQLVITLADYQYKHAFVADHELNMVACMTEIMAGITFK
jgi:DNA polymerase III delta prime subunit